MSSRPFFFLLPPVPSPDFFLARPSLSALIESSKARKLYGRIFRRVEQILVNANVNHVFYLLTLLYMKYRLDIQTLEHTRALYIFILMYMVYSCNDASRTRFICRKNFLPGIRLHVDVKLNTWLLFFPALLSFANGLIQPERILKFVALSLLRHP